MADSKPIRLSAERWALLCRHFAQMRYDWGASFSSGLECTLSQPAEIGGITFLPARYIGPDEADPMPAEPPVKPAPSAGQIGLTCIAARDTTPLTA